ncbi:hypothetical protein SCMU_14210 [Sinomonas cyclohexanicum]|uniref:Uncharacterized protein n=1 Tax=Sinomonas cyclohexanicum TaxID=322009 RepID=A0ABN6FG51_SINCY|nr:hypothetical protein [Corynebacterium cyclohexanicum]BCT75579.1 hypothetical protein SCMU_14210 [Corynebacterium cyclohexanicum]
MGRIRTTAHAALLRRYVHECRHHVAGLIAEARAAGGDDLLIITAARDVADKAATEGNPQARHYRALTNATIHHIHQHTAEGEPL